MTSPTAPSKNLSFTDPSTWVMLLTVAAAVITNLVHRDVSSWVPAASIIAAGLVTAVLLFAKHHYAQGVASLEQTASTAQTAAQAPGVPPELDRAVSAAQDALAGLQAAVTAVHQTT